MDARKIFKEIVSKGESALYDSYYYDEARSALVQIIKERALHRGDFILSSGKKSSYYLDLRKITLSSDSASLIGYLILSKIYSLDQDIQAIAGPTIGADPIVSSAVSVASLFDVDIKGLIVRKARKEYGLSKLIEGDTESVKNVVMVEDVVTTGGSLLDACRIVQSEGIQPVAAFPLVDRQETEVSEEFEKMHIFYEPLITISEIL
ncbi:MAG: orotate phosphoribosyltransferase [Actinobacteria bacterium]|nr:orotate phosphoribosyltransferase [Actinomycetota bacterium]